MNSTIDLGIGREEAGERELCIRIAIHADQIYQILLFDLQRLPPRLNYCSNLLIYS